MTRAEQIGIMLKNYGVDAFFPWTAFYESCFAKIENSEMGEQRCSYYDSLICSVTEAICETENHTRCQTYKTIEKRLKELENQ